MDGRKPTLMLLWRQLIVDEMADFMDQLGKDLRFIDIRPEHDFAVASNVAKATRRCPINTMYYWT